MIRSATSRPLLRPTTTPVLARAFSATSSAMAEGDTGAPKARGSLAEKDSFTRREAASEAMYIRNNEMEKLRVLQEKLKAQQKHMEELNKHIDEFTNGKSSEKH